MKKSYKRVIYFEDDKDMVELVRIILNRADFLVEGVGQGQPGINLVKQNQPDVVLLDLMLPDMDGWEIFRQLKKDEATKSIPVIIVTAKSQSVDKVLGIEIDQVDEYITKPFRPDELIERVNSVLIHEKP